MTRDLEELLRESAELIDQVRALTERLAATQDIVIKSVSKKSECDDE